MRVAIFSDVHGNLSGLQAVLADSEQHSPDQFIFAGDLCFLGARPAECLRLVRERRLPAVVGNTDEWLTGRAEPPEPRRQMADWGRAQLTAGERAWLGRLPFGLRLSPTARAADDLLIVHANPFDVNGILYPPEEEQRAHFGEVRQSDAAVGEQLSGVTAAVVAFGHLHLPSVRPLGRLTLVNVSSVSNPGDGDGRAKYALLEWTGGQRSSGYWTATHVRVAYDVAGEAAALRAAQPPGWEEAAGALERDGYYYPQKI